MPLGVPFAQSCEEEWAEELVAASVGTKYYLHLSSSPKPPGLSFTGSKLISAHIGLLFTWGADFASDRIDPILFNFLDDSKSKFSVQGSESSFDSTIDLEYESVDKQDKGKQVEREGSTASGHQGWHRLEASSSSDEEESVSDIAASISAIPSSSVPSSTAKAESHASDPFEDPVERELPHPGCTASSEFPDDPEDIPLAPPAFANLFPHISSITSLLSGPSPATRLSSLLSNPAAAQELPTLVRNITTEITDGMGELFKNFKKEADGMRKEFEDLKEKSEQERLNLRSELDRFGVLDFLAGLAGPSEDVSGVARETQGAKEKEDVSVCTNEAPEEEESKEVQKKVSLAAAFEMAQRQIRKAGRAEKRLVKRLAEEAREERKAHLAAKTLELKAKVAEMKAARALRKLLPSEIVEPSS